MDLCRNVTVSGGLPAEFPPEQVLSPPCSKLGSLDDLFSGHNTEVDVSLEWLSIFVEDCLSSTGNCLPQTPPNINLQKPTDIIPSKPLEESPLPQTKTKLVIPSKARSKRKRRLCPIIPKTHQTPLMSFTRRSWSHHNNNNNLNPQESDPPLLQQAYWLADSELIILPQKQEEVVVDGGGKERLMVAGSNGQHSRRCSHCLSQRTPQWRAGPMGPKTLCNACGVRYKSGRLLPEYRPAKSPTFVSYKHSNSHKKVLEMRTLSSLSATTHH